MLEWEFGSGLTFPNGTIFDALERSPALKDRAWRVFSGAGIGTITSALKGVSKFAVRDLADFVRQVQSPEYSWAYTFIEPSYGDFENGTFVGGSSQHPLDGVTNGEALIKEIYEAIRRSPHWMNSLLVVTWDEHGGFYDHVAPPAAVAPGDTRPSTGLNKYGFTFERYGVRVPAVIVSPWVSRNTIDHRLYDHASIPATLERLFGLQPLTRRDAQANDLTPLLSLPVARSDTPLELPSPTRFGNLAESPAPIAPNPNGPMPASQRGFLHLAMKHDIELSPPGAQPAIQARVASLRTRAEARDYIAEVKQKSRAATGSVQ
jgi:phospholipase C